MNRDQLNRTGMMSAVSAYMDTNKSLWQGVKAIADTVTDLNTSITAINNSAGKQITPVSGATDAKASVRHDYEEKILVVAAQLSALAEVKNDANLAGQSELTLSGLDKLADDDLEETGTRIAGLTTTNLAALADYGITAADVTELNNLTTQFHNVKTAPRTAVAGRAGQTATLPDMIADATSILRNRLDKLVTRYRKTNSGGINWRTVKSMTVQSVKVCYQSTEHYVYPLLALWTTLDTGSGNLDVEIDCPIIDEAQP